MGVGGRGGEGWRVGGRKGGKEFLHTVVSHATLKRSAGGPVGGGAAQPFSRQSVRQRRASEGARPYDAMARTVGKEKLANSCTQLAHGGY